MASPSSTISFSLALAGWWLPVVGLLLTGLGMALVTGTVGDLVAPIRPAWSIAGSMVTVEPRSGRAVLAASVGRLAGAGARAAIDAPPGRLDRPAFCLGADLATGRRAESAHLATVALPMPGECGDLRELLSGLATWDASGHATNADPQSIDSAVDSRQAKGIDLMAGAHYGPPDRQPQAALEEEVMDRGRGRVRAHLEETAAARRLMP